MTLGHASTPAWFVHLHHFIFTAGTFQKAGSAIIKTVGTDRVARWLITRKLVLSIEFMTIRAINGLGILNSLEFEVKVAVPETMTIGSTWLRVRAHCNHVLFEQITAYNWLSGQGETEDYQLNVVNNPAPEPATLLLFGAGLVGLASLRLRKKMK